MGKKPFVDERIHGTKGEREETQRLMRVVDRARFERATFWSFDLLGDPEGLQTRRSAGLIYRPTSESLLPLACFNPYVLAARFERCQARLEHL